MFHQVLILVLFSFPVLSEALSDDDRLEQRLTVLETAFQSDIQTREKENSLLKSELESLKSEVNFLKYRYQGNGNVSLDDETASDDVSRQKVASRDTRKSHKTNKASTSYAHSEVAFQAMLEHNIGSLGDDETIKFTKADLNLGNDYNVNTGMFTCSVPGLYVFHTNIVNYDGKSVELHFLKNGHMFGRVYLGDEDSFRSESASFSVLVQLEVSDRVWISSNTNHDSGEVLRPGYCFFTGYLLFPDSV